MLERRQPLTRGAPKCWTPDPQLSPQDNREIGLRLLAVKALQKVWRFSKSIGTAKPSCKSLWAPLSRRQCLCVTCRA